MHLTITIAMSVIISLLFVGVSLMLIKPPNKTDNNINVVGYVLFIVAMISFLYALNITSPTTLTKSTVAFTKDGVTVPMTINTHIDKFINSNNYYVKIANKIAPANAKYYEDYLKNVNFALMEASVIFLSKRFYKEILEDSISLKLDFQRDVWFDPKGIDAISGDGMEMASKLMTFISNVNIEFKEIPINNLWHSDVAIKIDVYVK